MYSGHDAMLRHYNGLTSNTLFLHQVSGYGITQTAV